jgi:hypothetical protein
MLPANAIGSAVTVANSFDFFVVALDAGRRFEQIPEFSSID